VTRACGKHRFLEPMARDGLFSQVSSTCTVSTTGKQQRGYEHYWHRKGAGIHYWQAAELVIVGRRPKKIVKKFFIAGGLYRESDVYY